MGVNKKFFSLPFGKWSIIKNLIHSKKTNKENIAKGFKMIAKIKLLFSVMV